MVVKTRFCEAYGGENTRLWVKWLWKHALVSKMVMKTRFCEADGSETHFVRRNGNENTHLLG